LKFKLDESITEGFLVTAVLTQRIFVNMKSYFRAVQLGKHELQTQERALEPELR
jgi:hypothetical protein